MRIAMVMPTDVSVQTDVEALAESTVQQLGGIDVWVNNAGAGAVGRFDEIPLTAHVRVIDIDLMGTLYGSYYAMRQFHAQGRGTLINVASICATTQPIFVVCGGEAGVVGRSHPSGRAEG